MRPLIQLARDLQMDPESRNALLANFTSSNTFPIVDEQNATFFYWDGKPTDNVHLRHWVYGLESRQAFQRIPNTDAFWLSVDLPHSARVEYKLEVQRDGNSFWTRDPHNAERAFDPFGSNSVCAMPGYVQPEWSKEDGRSRKGRLETFRIHSDAFGEEREVTLYLPNEHRPRKSYPLLICHDGSDYRRFASIVTVLDNLIHRHEVIPLIVAFTNGVNRNPEYGANPLQARYLVEDLLPAIEERHKIAPGPENRGLMGASFGAVSSLYAAWMYPGVFQKLLLQSGSFAFTDIGEHGRGELWDPVVEFVNALRSDPSPVDGKVFMSCGIFESLIYYNRSLAPLLRNSGVKLCYEEAQDGHNWINWRDRLRAGLNWLFPGHLWMYYE